jgi:RNA polymerase sigma-70 factor (ECF subfamily)
MTVRETTFRERALDASPDAAAELDVAMQMGEDAFRGFYDRTSRMLWTYLARLTGDRQAADDLLQECYYRLLRSNATLESESHRRHYLFRIATNLVHDRHRQRRTQPMEVGGDVVDLAVNVSDHAEGTARRVEVSQALGRLKPRERALLWLAYAQGASHEEIAGVVGVRRGSVKVLLSRARRKLAEVLS